MINKVRYELFRRRDYDKLARPVSDHKHTLNVNVSLDIVKILGLVRQG